MAWSRREAKPLPGREENHLMCLRLQGVGDKVGRGLAKEGPLCPMKGLGIYSVGGGSHGRALSRSRGFGGSETADRFYRCSGLHASRFQAAGGRGCVPASSQAGGTEVAGFLLSRALSCSDPMGSDFEGTGCPFGWGLVIPSPLVAVLWSPGKVEKPFHSPRPFRAKPWPV